MELTQEMKNELREMFREELLANGNQRRTYLFNDLLREFEQDFEDLAVTHTWRGSDVYGKPINYENVIVREGAAHNAISALVKIAFPAKSVYDLPVQAKGPQMRAFITEVLELIKKYRNGRGDSIDRSQVSASEPVKETVLRLAKKLSATEAHEVIREMITMY